jgi:hypothetical protein
VGPITFGPGITYTSTRSRSMFGYTGEYGFGPDASWVGTPMIGLNSSYGTITLSFARPLSGFVAEINSTEFADWGRDATVSAYDSAGNLLDTLLFEQQGYQVEPGYWGFSYTAAQIARITFSNEYIAVRNISVVMAVPEPVSWAMMLSGFGLVGGILRHGGRRPALRRG